MSRKNSLLILVGILGSAMMLAGASNPWGSLKKIEFFGANGNHQEVRRILEDVNANDLPREERRQWVEELLRVGDAFASQGQLELAQVVYRKILSTSPQTWYVYNRLEKVRHTFPVALPSPDSVWKQLVQMLTSFSPSLFMFIGFTSLLLGTGVLVYFFFMLFIMWKYFKLVANDFLQQRKSPGFFLRVGLVVAILCWPFLTGSWAAFPFLIAGVFWVYMEKEERKAATWLTILGLAFSVLYGIGRGLERRAGDEGFQRQERLYYGMDSPETLASEELDSEETLFLALSYYEAGDYDKTLVQLTNLPPAFRHPLRFNLAGIIQYKTGQVEQSIQSFREALMIDDKDQAILKNLTLAVLKSERPDQIESYIKRYPEIRHYQQEIENLSLSTPAMDMKLPSTYLWQKILAHPHKKIGILTVARILLQPLAWLPLLSFTLLFVLLRFACRRLFPFIGQSEYCSKCSKILKRKMFEHVHVLCEDCYQLFMVKDAIFFEAKMLKEREIIRRQRRRALIFHLVSLVIPGFALNFYEKSRTFLFVCWSVYFLLGYGIYLSLVMRKYFGAVPLFLLPLGIVAVLLYLAVNLYSLKGLNDGF